MEKVRLWCGQPSDRGRLKNRTEQICLRMRSRICDHPRTDADAIFRDPNKSGKPPSFSIPFRPRCTTPYFSAFGAMNVLRLQRTSAARDVFPGPDVGLGDLIT